MNVITQAITLRTIYSKACRSDTTKSNSRPSHCWEIQDVDKRMYQSGSGVVVSRKIATKSAKLLERYFESQM